MKTRRGIALMMVLLVTVLLMLLSSALLTLNRDSLGSLRGTADRQKAQHACVSAVDYVRARLGADLAYGTIGFGAETVRLNLPGQLEIREAGTGAGSNVIRGVDFKLGSRFTCRILNRMSSTTATAAPSWARRRAAIPPRSCLVVVDGLGGDTSRHLECLLQRRYFANAPLVAEQDLAVFRNASSAASVLRFTSDNPRYNGLRSNARILLSPDANFGSTPHAGRVTSLQDVSYGGYATVDSGTGQITALLGGHSLASDPARRSTAENATNSTIITGQGQTMSGLSASELKTPPGSAKPLPGGRYVFRNGRTVEYFASPSATVPSAVFTDVIPENAASVGAPAVYLKDHRFIPAGKVQVSGAMTLASSDNAAPQLAVGYQSNGHLDPNNLVNSSFEVNGSLSVSGDIAGFGAVITRKNGADNGALTLHGKSQLSAAPDLGTALYAEGPIKMLPVLPKATQAPDAFTALDFDVLRTTRTRVSRSTLNSWSTLDPDTRALAVRDSLRAELDNYTYPSLAPFPGWISDETPSGLPLPNAAKEFVRDCMTSHDEDGNVVPKPMTVEDHYRVQQFLKSVDAGSPDSSWLSHAQRDADVGAAVDSLFRTFDKEGRRQANPVNLGGYLDQPNPLASKDYRDIELKGVVYTGANFWANGNRAFRVEGAIAASSGSLAITGVEYAQLHFNSTLMENLLSERNVKLQTVGWWLE
jgi:hypothetical protein